MAWADSHCDHANRFWTMATPCPADVGFEPGWKICEDEPTNRPAAGRTNHNNRTICNICWQRIMRNAATLALDFGREITNALDEIIYQQILHPGGPTWNLRNHAVVRGFNNNLEATQALLCTHCTEKEIAKWRRCEADQKYADLVLAGKAEHVENGHTNTCICRKKYITGPHYCYQCLKDALDDRLITADYNKQWLKDIGHSAGGERRLVSRFGRLQRAHYDMTIPCRCGREVDRTQIAAAPKATFCLACNGTKVFTNNVPAARYPIRTTQTQLPDPAAPYPLQWVVAEVQENQLSAYLQPGARTIRESRF